MLQKKILNIVGMHCTACAMDIDGQLEDTIGVKEARTHYAKQQTEVSFDDEKVSLEEIVKVVNGLNYQVELKQ